MLVWRDLLLTPQENNDKVRQQRPSRLASADLPVHKSRKQCKDGLKIVILHWLMARQ